MKTRKEEIQLILKDIKSEIKDKANGIFATNSDRSVESDIISLRESLDDFDTYWKELEEIMNEDHKKVLEEPIRFEYQEQL